MERKMKAKEILKNGDTAVMIFTDGRNLKINADGKGESGVWVINRNLDTDKVIIYLRNKDRNINEIYLGDFSHLTPSKIKGYENRFVVVFNNMKFIRTTNENWNGFTDTKRGAVSPIKYIR
jgi:hypothetical protein